MVASSVSGLDSYRHINYSGLAHLLPPQQFASVARQTLLENSPEIADADTMLVNNLRQALYNANGWQRGMMSTAIAHLAESRVVHSSEKEISRKTHIVTTNYDDYLERAMLKMQLEGDDAPEFSPLITMMDHDNRVEYVSSESLSDSEELNAAIDRIMDSDLSLHYLHGRIPNSDGRTGKVVLSEDHYYETASSSLVLLNALFEDATVLILGSSLSDPPLVQACAKLSSANRIQGKRTYQLPGANKIHAVQDLLSLGFANLNQEEFTEVEKFYLKRCTLLGVELSIPDFRYQVPQLLAWMADATRNENALSKTPSQITDRWRSDWEAHVNDADEHATELQESLSVLREKIEDILETKRYAEENFRVELWVVGPDACHATPTLERWGCSSYVVKDKELRIRRHFELFPNFACVQAITEGRPVHLDIEEIRGLCDSDRVTGRWRSFFCLPVYVNRSTGYQHILSGAVTLGSSKPKLKSSLSQVGSARLENVRHALITEAQRILGHWEDADEGSPDE